MPERHLGDLDGKFWKNLKKQAGIKSSGWFKKADASVGKHIEDLNKARLKFIDSDAAALAARKDIDLWFLALPHGAAADFARERGHAEIVAFLER